MPRLPARLSRRRAAFTLIEILAVVLILALLAGIVAPNVGLVQSRKLRHDAMRLASHLELARQRTVVTGVPHRVALDLENGTYRLELETRDTPDADSPILPVEYDVSGGTPLPLSPPTTESGDYQPIPGLLGNQQLLEEELFFAGLETPEGWIEEGHSYVAFDRNGTAAWTEIVLEDVSGRQMVLEILPLDDAIRITEEGD